MAEEVRWRVIPLHTPFVLRRCPRCDVRRPFVSSDKFRVNGSGRKLDVWLIYKCTHCKQTWNSTILSRVSPESIAPDLYQAFLDNDFDTAWRYAFDFEVLKRNQAEVDPNVEIRVEGAAIDLASCSAGQLRISIEPRLVLNARLDTLLVQRLGLSRRKIHALAEAGAIRVEPAGEIDRKLKRAVVVTIDVEALKAS